jgi:hypothetical protein
MMKKASAPPERLPFIFLEDEEGGGYGEIQKKYGGGKSQKPALYGGSGCQLKYCFYFSSDFKS